ncbi:MAG TPA: YbhB/YbcL family Raf kinase inhibitor-like protein [Steroidobacteraceae bacterium]|nr:YbhB/YbcL family Raf kinase inhibitor-like protein [Steroidobacteraceae bacterium]
MAMAPMSIAAGELDGVNASIAVSSPAFGPNQPIPAQYTADGAGVSPPLEWRGVPMNAEAVVLIIEDADTLTPQSRVNAIAWDLPGSDTSLPEGALPCASGATLSATYLPPDPPPGRGPHRYAFQVFALDTVPRFESRPGRAELLDRIKGHVIAQGVLIGTYGR